MSVQQVEMLYKNIPITLMNMMISATMLVCALSNANVPFDKKMLIWLACIFTSLLIYVLISLSWRYSAHKNEQWLYWRKIFTLACIPAGIAWSGAFFLLASVDYFEQAFWVVMIEFGMAVLLVFSSSSYSRPSILFICLILLPYIIWDIAWYYNQGERLGYYTNAGAYHPYHYLSFLGVVGISVIYLIAKHINKNLMSLLKLKAQNAILIKELKKQRAQTQQANDAKIDSFDKVNHKLRQFAQVLSTTQLDIESDNIKINKDLEIISHSIKEIEYLLESILINATQNQSVVRKTIFPVKKVLTKINSQYEETAKNKDIQLIVYPCDAFILSNTEELYRILSNLVKNALNFTAAKGKVEIICQCIENNEKLSIAVQDNGCGIATKEHDNIFKEYYRIEKNAMPQAQGGGGLGLSIVTKSLKLLNCPRIELISDTDQGAIFKFIVPIADINETTYQEEQEVIIVLTKTTQHQLILLIDDNIDVRKVIADILIEWGYDVIATSSLQQMLKQLENCQKQPALILSDYLLENGEKGIDAIRILQNQYKQHIPGLLITGSLKPSDLEKFRQSKLKALHKPVLNHVLYKAITDLIENPYCYENESL